MRKTITLELRTEDAEPMLRKAAENAAKYGAFADFVTRHTYFSPRRLPKPSFEEWRGEQQARFLAAKRIVEAFGVEYEATSEEETMTVYFEQIGGRRKIVNLGPPIGRIAQVTGSRPDYKHPKPAYRVGVHDEACRQAADRVVRRWRAMIEQAKAA